MEKQRKKLYMLKLLKQQTNLTTLLNNKMHPNVINNQKRTQLISPKSYLVCTKSNLQCWTTNGLFGTYHCTQATVCPLWGGIEKKKTRGTQQSKEEEFTMNFTKLDTTSYSNWNLVKSKVSLALSSMGNIFVFGAAMTLCWGQVSRGESWPVLGTSEELKTTSNNWRFSWKNQATMDGLG